MTIKPLADRVLVKPAPAEEKTVGGHHHSRHPHRKNPAAARWWLWVKARRTKPWCSKPETMCSTVNMPAPKWEIDGEKLLIMRQSDVLAVVE